MKKKAIVVYFVSILILLIGIFFFDEIYNKDETDDTLKIAVTNMPETFDSMTRLEFFTNLVNNEIYSTLFEQSNYVPKSLLGKHWVNVSDSLLSIELISGLRFDNGDLIRSFDVKASIERYINYPKSVSYKALVIDSIVILDTNRLLVYHRPSNVVYRLLFYMPVYSLKQIQPGTYDFDMNNIICSGNYFVHAFTDKKIILKLNPYRKEVKGRFKNIEVNYIPSKDEQVNKILNNEIDFIINPPIDRFSILEKTKNVIIDQRQSTASLYMMLDSQSEHNSDINQKKNPLKDVLVRKAIWSACDITSFINDNLFGYARAISFPWPAHLTGFDSTLKPPGKNTEYAKNLLKQASYPNGFYMKIYCIQNKFNGDIELGDYVKSSLKEINIDADIFYLPSKEFYEKISNEKVACFITGFTSYSKSIESALNTMFYNNGKGRKGAMNRTSIYNPELSAIIEELQPLQDSDSHKIQLMYKASKIVYDQVYVVPFYNPMDVYAYSNKVKWSSSGNELLLGNLHKR